MLIWHEKTFGPTSWEDAKKYCDGLGKGWRLPTVQELIQLVDYSKQPVAPENMMRDGYWTSALDMSDNHKVCAWFVNFASGHTGTYLITAHCFVRAVKESISKLK